MDAALAALDELSKRHDTLEALVLAGGHKDFLKGLLQHMAMACISRGRGGQKQTFRVGAAGGVDVLEQTVEQRWLDDEAAQDTAAALLVALRVQQDHHG